jgi:hypothetical protein
VGSTRAELTLNSLLDDSELSARHSQDLVNRIKELSTAIESRDPTVVLVEKQVNCQHRIPVFV